MALIPKLSDLNEHRKNYLKIETVNDETVIFTRNEIKEVLLKYIADELDLFSNLSYNKKQELSKQIDENCFNIQTKLLEYIDEKFDRITEVIVERTLSRKIEAEVEKRLKEILNK